LNRRDFAGTIGFGALGLLTGGVGTAAAAAPDEIGDLSFVHPELRESARQALQTSATYKLTPALIQTVRAMPKTSRIPVRPDIPVVEKRVPVGGGAPDVLVYVVNAKPGTQRAAILHTHGGGFVLGSAKESIGDMQAYAAELDCVVVTVEYRLAPETRYSGSIEDNYAALKWLYNNAKELGVNQSRIAVMGESAGGGHAALLALRARDRGEVPVLFQMLVYPMLDDRTGSSRVVAKNIGTIVWDAQANRFGWESFLGQRPGTRAVPVAAVPARVGNLAGLPPTFIGVGGIDLFVDEDIGYARRLTDAGVPTELLVVPGAFHGFDVMGEQTPIAKRFIAAKMDALRRAFAGES
jgi:acetyl esterase/lipase